MIKILTIYKKIISEIIEINILKIFDIKSVHAYKIMIFFTGTVQKSGINRHQRTSTISCTIFQSPAAKFTNTQCLSISSSISYS